MYRAIKIRTRVATIRYDVFIYDSLDGTDFAHVLSIYDLNRCKKIKKINKKGRVERIENVEQTVLFRNTIVQHRSTKDRESSTTSTIYCQPDMQFRKLFLIYELRA